MNVLQYYILGGPSKSGRPHTKRWFWWAQAPSRHCWPGGAPAAVTSYHQPPAEPAPSSCLHQTMPPNSGTTTMTKNFYILASSRIFNSYQKQKARLISIALVSSKLPSSQEVLCRRTLHLLRPAASVSRAPVTQQPSSSPLESTYTQCVPSSQRTSYPTSVRTISVSVRSSNTSTACQERSSRRQLSTTTASKMASDSDYMAFLDKANKNPSEGFVKEQSKEDVKGFRATQEGVEVPRAISEVVNKGEGAFYVSDADEPFEAVALRLEGKGLPDEEEFARLINHPTPKEASVEILDPVDWDRNGQYAEIIDAVREAGEGSDVRVYRVARGGVKAEYWVVTATGDAKLVGVKALAVES